jgi:predicted Zn-dependent peptidase
MLRTTVLANGLEVLAECSPHALSTAIGFFVRTGSRDESPDLAGVSHFLEHMAFKGSSHRSADDVNREFDDIGAKYNAYTTEEHTVFHAAVLPEYTEKSVDLLADLLRPTLRQEDFEMEKKVILEEIGMYADSAMWTAYERAMRLHFLDHPVGNSVLGTTESVTKLTPAAMREYHEHRYGPSNIFVAAAGNIDWERFLALVDKHCGHWSGPKAERKIDRKHAQSPGEVINRDQFAQESVLMIAPGPPADSSQRIAAEVLANIVGDDTGSRLYWSLVETGKVDSVDFSYHEYEGVGAFMLNLSCEPDLADEDLRSVRETLLETTRRGVTQEELARAKNKLGARIVLAAERPQNRLFALGGNWSYRREYRTVDDDLADLGAVDLAAVEKLLKDYPLDLATTVCLGPLANIPSFQAG